LAIRNEIKTSITIITRYKADGLDFEIRASPFIIRSFSWISEVSITKTTINNNTSERPITVTLKCIIECLKE